jgi:hypothetical protein
MPLKLNRCWQRIHDVTTKSCSLTEFFPAGAIDD